MCVREREDTVFIRNYNNANGGVDKYLDRIAVLRLTEDAICVFRIKDEEKKKEWLVGFFIRRIDVTAWHFRTAVNVSFVLLSS